MFGGSDSAFKNLDYVACWLQKAADYVSDFGGTAAFVATNSICQGENVQLLWPRIFRRDVIISFAYASFHWKNNAVNNAGITCVILGLSRSLDVSVKKLYSDQHVTVVQHISPYLTATRSVVVEKASTPLNGMQEMVYGSKPLDWGYLTLSTSEKVAIEQQYPDSKPLFKRYIGSEEFIDGTDRWCLWITEDTVATADAIEPIRRRILACKKKREAGGMSAKAQARTPYRFMLAAHQDTDAFLIPMVSSERRQYLQIGLMPRTTVINSNAYAIYNGPLYLFAVLSSRMHAVWAYSIGGRMRNDPRYSHNLIYNTFPIPHLSTEQETIMADRARSIIRARGAHPGKTIAWMYNPETMPKNLLEAHQANDVFLDEHVYGRTFADDMQRLEKLFSMYEQRAATAINGNVLL